MARNKKLTRLQREAIEAARRTQSRTTGEEIMASHMMQQTSFGWQVHVCHPNEPDPAPASGRIAKLDALCQSPRGTNRMRLRMRQEQVVADARKAHLKALTQLRDQARAHMRRVAHCCTPDE